ncbi:MAG TPA: carboxypeptidase regulatory-like domain-containing protein [Vicinamibacterales bacterium]
MWRPSTVLLLALFLGVTASASAQTARGRVHGRVLDASGLPLPGVTVMLSHDAGTPLETHTDEVGHYDFQVPFGRYALTAQLEGFGPAVRANLLVSAEPLVVDVVLELSAFTTETQVVAQVPRVMTVAEPSAPATVDNEIIKMAPVQGMRYDSALPLLPSVVRGPDGLISMSGARASQGTVLVDRMRETDPVSGQPSLTVPITSIDSVKVYTPSPPAEAGPGSGGITTVITKAAGDSFRFNVFGLFPRPRFSEDRGVSGFESWNPVVGLSGPIAKGKVWIAQSFEYRWERFQFETVEGRRDSRTQSWTSFTRLEIKPSGPHQIIARVAAFPDRVQHFGMSAFTPPATVPDLHTGGISVGVLDRMALGNGSTLEARVHVRRHALEMVPYGSWPYQVGHDRTFGSYYLSIDRQAYRVEASATWSQPVKGAHGEHLLKGGGLVSYATVDGVATARPVDYLRSDGLLARRVEFTGAGKLDASAREVGLFIQDAWSVRPGFRLDAGVRLDTSSAVPGVAVWPRMGWAYDVRANKTKLSGSAGVFSDKPILSSSIFDQQQSRQERLFDTFSRSVGSWRLYTNRVRGPLAMPRAFIWTAQVDHALTSAWMLRAVYQERFGRRDLVVRPVVTSATEGELRLSADGESHVRSLELTAGFRSAHGMHQFYMSYVRSETTADLNDLNTVAGNAATAQVIENQRGATRSDIPHRFLAWGILSMPWRMTVSPFIEVRSGFPFTRIDENWDVVGRRNDARFPRFVSLDVAVEKALTMPFGIPARLGLKVFNITGRNNGRSIQRDVERADFGRTYDPIRRQLRGTLEIAWSR